MKKILKKILDETYDEDEVFSLPLDEDIQISSSPTHQEENMMSYNPFENFDDALFHAVQMKKIAKRISMKFLLQKA
jgi:hypothetical protein